MSAQPPSNDFVPALRELVGMGRFHEALELHGRAGDSAVLERPEVQLLAATAAVRLGQLEMGERLASTALERFRTRADSDGRMRSTNLLGKIAFEHGRTADAGRYFEEALVVARDLQDSLMAAHASNNLATLADMRGHSASALSYFRSALLSYQRLGDRRGTAWTYHNLGIALRHLRDWKGSIAAAEQAVRHAEKAADSVLVAIAVTGQVAITLERGELGLARGELERAADLVHAAGDEIGAIEIGRLRAQLALLLGDFPAAAEAAAAARSAAEQHQSVLLQAECASVAAFALRSMGKTEEAEARREEAVRLFQGLGAATWLNAFSDEWGEG